MSQSKLRSVLGVMADVAAIATSLAICAATVIIAREVANLGARASAQAQALAKIQAQQVRPAAQTVQQKGAGDMPLGTQVPSGRKRFVGVGGVVVVRRRIELLSHRTPPLPRQRAGLGRVPHQPWQSIVVPRRSPAQAAT